MGMKARFGRLLGVILVAGVLNLPLLVPASAVCADVEDRIFVKSTASSSNTNGTTNKIFLKNRVLDDCSTASDFCNEPIPLGLSTAHMQRSASKGSLSGDWVEIGWVEFWESPGVHEWDIFTEKGLNGSLLDCFQMPAPNLVPGTYDEWRVSGVHNPNGSVDWTLRVDFLIGQGYATVKTYNTSWGQNSAVALGETERKGPESGMNDEQIALKYKNDSGSWVNWPDVDCIIDEASDYQWDRVSANSYKVEATGDPC